MNEALKEEQEEQYFKDLHKQFEQVHTQIKDACRLAGRGDEPILLAATKTVSAPHINYAIEHLGLCYIGENKVQELLEKYPDINKSAHIHFIGRLQRNKVKYIIDKVEMIHSVDSLPLALEIQRQAEKKDVHMDVLLQVNTGKEAQKGGFLPEELEEALRSISALSRVHVRGLMAVAPICEKKSDYLHYFQETYQNFIDFSQKKLHNISMDILSMGMSDSYTQAIACGSTMIRVGSALFGKRTYQITNDQEEKKEYTDEHLG